jgi:hypothetical protein
MPRTVTLSDLLLLFPLLQLSAVFSAARFDFGGISFSDPVLNLALAGQYLVSMILDVFDRGLDLVQRQLQDACNFLLGPTVLVVMEYVPNGNPGPGHSMINNRFAHLWSPKKRRFHPP